jgi:hypothetical protein
MDVYTYRYRRCISNQVNNLNRCGQAVKCDRFYSFSSINYQKALKTARIAINQTARVEIKYK